MRRNEYIPPNANAQRWAKQGSQSGYPLDHGIRRLTAPRPYIIRPTKRHSYRNILSSCLLVPLGSSPIQIEPVQAENKHKSPTPRTWQRLSITDVPINESNHVCVGSLLSVSSREEQANASPKNTYDRNAESLSHGLEALNTDLTETSFVVPKSTLSVDAKIFRPSEIEC
jgi:hypothetical protein